MTEPIRVGVFGAELTAFVAAIQSGTPPPVTGPDGRIPVMIAPPDRSLQERRPPRVDEMG